MKALIVHYIDSEGQKIKLLGLGETEQEARRDAFRFLNRGFNDFEQEEQSGSVVNVSEELYNDHIKYSDQCNVTIDTNSGLCGTSMSDRNFLWSNWAIHALYIDNRCELKSRIKPGDTPWLR